MPANFDSLANCLPLRKSQFPTNHVIARRRIWNALCDPSHQSNVFKPPLLLSSTTFSFNCALMYLKAPVLEYDSEENLMTPQFRISLKPSAAEPIDVSSAEPIVDRLLTKLGVLQITLTVLASPELQAAIKLLVQEFEAELKSLAHILQRTIIVIPEIIPWPDPEEDGCASDCIPFRHDDDEEDGYGVWHFISLAHCLERQNNLFLWVRVL